MNAIGIIFANIYDSSLGELTNKRTMASLPFAGRYRQIDFSLSNMSNSGIRRIGIISRYNFQSLMNHIGSGEEWDLELQEGGLEFITPFSLGTSAQYQGKIDALYSALEYFDYGRDDEYAVLAEAGTLYNIDLDAVIDSHIASGKDLTIVTKAGVANGQKQHSLALHLDKDGNIDDIGVDFAAPEGYLTSISLFVINRKRLVEEVRQCIARNHFRFERDFILRRYNEGALSLNIYQHSGVVLFNESPAEYFQNNLATINKDVRKDLFHGHHSIYTKVRDRVPSYYAEGCQVDNCTVADGCILEGNVKNSVLFRQVTIGAGAKVENCVIMNDTVVGENCELKCVILDKDVTVRPGSRLIGTPTAPVTIKRGETV